MSSLLLIFIDDLGVGYCLHACFFHTGEELCLLSTVALALFFLSACPLVNPVGYTFTKISVIPGEMHHTSPLFVPSGR